MDVSEQEEPPSDAEFWLPHNHQVAFRWTREGAGPWSVTGMVMYGDVTAERLRGVRMTGASAPRIGPWSTSKSLTFEDPPTEEDLRPFWRGVSGGDGQSWGGVTKAEGSLIAVAWRPQTDFDSRRSFLEFVAATFRDLEAYRPSDTTKALAEVADVPFTTAVNWVRECRSAELLPKSKRQMKGQSNG